MRSARIIVLAGFGVAAVAQVSAARVPTADALQIQMTDSSILAPREAAPIASPIAVSPLAVDMVPAPLPNADMDEPHLIGPPSARISPALLSRAALFEGNGFSNASNNDHGIDERTQPAAGLNLFVPVK